MNSIEAVIEDVDAKIAQLQALKVSLEECRGIRKEHPQLQLAGE